MLWTICFLVVSVCVAIAATPPELADAYRAERAKATEGERLMPAFPIARADEVFRRGEELLKANRPTDAARLIRQARWLLPPVPPELPPHLAMILGNPRMRHASWISCVAFSPSGNLLATAGQL